MDPVSIAAAQVGAQAALAQTSMAVSLIKQQQDTQQQLLAMLAAQAAPPPGTGVHLNAQA